MVPPDRADQCNHICLVYGKGPNGSIVMPLAGASNLGKVMRGRYLGQVGRHKPCEPELFARFVPVWDRFCQDGGRKTFGRHGPPRTEPKRGVGRSGRESVMAVGRFCRNAVGPPEWQCEAMDSVVWVKCATSAECI